MSEIENVRPTILIQFLLIRDQYINTPPVCTYLPVQEILNFLKPCENWDRTVQARKFFFGNWTKPTVFYGTAVQKNTDNI